MGVDKSFVAHRIVRGKCGELARNYYIGTFSETPPEARGGCLLYLACSDPVGKSDVNLYYEAIRRWQKRVTRMYPSYDSDVHLQHRMRKPPLFLPRSMLLL